MPRSSMTCKLTAKTLISLSPDLLDSIGFILLLPLAPVLRAYHLPVGMTKTLPSRGLLWPRVDTLIVCNTTNTTDPYTTRWNACSVPFSCTLPADWLPSPIKSSSVPRKAWASIWNCGKAGSKDRVKKLTNIRSITIATQRGTASPKTIWWWIQGLD